MDAAEESDYSSMKRERSRSPIDDDRDGDNDHGDRDRNRRSDRSRRTERPRGSGRRGSEDTRIYVSNIPYEYKWQDLKDLFRKEVGDVAYVEMFNDENNRPRGCALIEFETIDSVNKAVKIMHRYELKGRKLVVKEKADDLPLRLGSRMTTLQGGGPSRQDFDLDRERRIKSEMRGRDYSRGGDLSGPPSMGSLNKYGNTYGLSTVFLESLGITGPLVSKVFVANLDYKVDDKMLKDVFKIAGKVITVEISKDQDGKSRGFGVVEFEHPVEAVQAISMFHNQTYFERKMSVRMDRVTEKESTTTKLPPGLKSLGMGLGVNGSALTDVASETEGGISMLTRSLPTAVASGVTAMPGVSSMATSMSSMGGQNMGMMGMGGTGGMGTGMGNMGTGMGNMGTGMGNMGTGMGSMGTGMNNLGTGMGSMGSGLNNLGNGMMGGMGGSGLSGSSNMVSSLAGGGSGLASSTMARSSLAASPGYGSYGSSSLSRDYNHAGGGSSSSNPSYTGGYRNIIQLSNLPLDYTWQALRDLCREFGDIRFAEIRSKGTGTVRFQTESDSRRAVEMLDRQRLDGRILDVVLL